VRETVNFQMVVLWSDICVALLLAGLIGLAVFSVRRPLLRAAWGRVGASRPGMAAATILVFFALVGLLDSLHYRPRLENAGDGKAVYSVEVLSALDALASPLRERVEKTYSAPFAAHSYSRESIEIEDADGQKRQGRDFPRLTYGGAHLQTDADGKLSGRAADIAARVLLAFAAAAGVWIMAASAVVYALARRRARTLESPEIPWRQTLREIGQGKTVFAWNSVLAAFGVLLMVLMPLFFLCADYHVFGTDKVGTDVFYQVLKSIRTALVIGLVATLVTMPLALILGLLAGHFRGWIDDLVQYLYTTLNSIPGVLLIAASIMMMQVVIDTHPHWFSTAAERADLRLLALCFILGLTSWTSLCRLLRGETLKLRELEYIQAAQAFGVPSWRIMARHLAPNLMHIIVITLAMDFSSLVLAEAVLSYIGIGVDPLMISFGTMIDNARMELSRDPAVWWSLSAAFAFMLALVLSANLLADAVRDAFDPRLVR